MKSTYAPASAFNIYVATDAAVPGKAGASAALIDQFNKMPRGGFVFVEADPTLLYYKGSSASYASGNRIRLVATGSGGFIPPDDNLTDLGDSTHRFRTLYLGTSLTNSDNLTIDLTGGATRSLTILNSTLGQVCNVTVDGSLAAKTGLISGGGVFTDTDNTTDLAATGFAFRRLYLKTGIIVESGLLTLDIQAGGVGSLAITNSGVGEAGLTVDGDITLNGVDPLITTNNGVDSNVSLRAKGTGTLRLRDATNAVTVLGVQNKFIVGTIDDQSNANGGLGGDCTSTSSLGKAAIAAGSQACTVTVAGLSPVGMVLVAPIDRDGTATDLVADAGAGSFTVTASGVATAKTRFAFEVIKAAAP